MFFGGGGGGFPGFDPEEMGGMGGGRSRKKVDNTSLYKLLSRRGERCPGPRPGGMSCNLDQLPSPCPGPPLPPIGGGVTSISEPVVGLSDVGIGERRRVDPRMPQEDPFESRGATKDASAQSHRLQDARRNVTLPWGQAQASARQTKQTQRGQVSQLHSKSSCYPQNPCLSAREGRQLRLAPAR
jgi:hypothetical protein